uniref:Uncharacterized protein n=1 Tax=Chromera velia CCMP2878 TaxID=1169474 RepID=A0A0G4HHY9_9ALVE|eukprot:Cvel_27733.t1-p1 / transcript=Cvel_27733.t1 / gene=Cvel_27733 / organism=Chromera_velia_CCMP2878 / gene_product=hypothetical protein / transcript_product=hypothetical protein / location=Cvel_scaffold3511:10245-11243(-) / protein_length=132 / sequence_SO=supercontig / SO=protein_coding / is_pseudo=false
MTSRGKEGDALTEEVSLETLNKGPKERESEEEDAEDNEIKAQQLALISEPLLAKKDPNAPFPLCKDDDAASEYWYNPEEPTGIYEKPSPKDHVFECTMVISDIVITMMEAIYFSVVVGEHPNCNASDWPFLW